jgi:hypothetical protein
VPVAALPRRQRALERLVLLRLRRIAGHGVEAPRQLAGLGIVGRHVAAHAVLRAAVADDDLPVRDARRAGDCVRLVLIDRRRLPCDLAARRIDRGQPSVEHTDVDTALVERGAAIDDVTAGDVVVLAMHFGVVLPQLLAGARVDRVGDAPRSGRIHHAVDDQRRRLEAAVRRGFELPRETELRDIAIVDLIERTESLFVIVAAVRQPILVARVGRPQGGIVHRGFLLGGAEGDEGGDEGDDASGKRTVHRYS